MSPVAVTPAEAEAAFSLPDILRHSLKLSGSRLGVVAIGVPVNLLIARVLGPERYGVIGLVALWQFYAGLFKLGIAGAAFREVPMLLGRARNAEAVRVQNIGLTAESLYLAAPCAVLLAASFLQSTVELRMAFILGAVAFLAGQLRDLASNIQLARQRFGVMARANLVAASASAAVVGATIWWFPLGAALLAPGIAALCMLVVFQLAAPPSGFQVQWNGREIWRLLKVGLPLSGSALLYWSFRTVDQVVIANWLSLAQLGLFSFVMQFVTLGVMLVVDFITVVQPRLFSELGRADDVTVVGAPFSRLTVATFFAACVAISLAQAAFGLFVQLFVPSFLGSVSTFEIMVFLLACGSVHNFPSNVLISPTLNKQAFPVIAWSIGLPLNAGLAFLAYRAGLGLQGIAGASVLAQTIIAALLLVRVREYLFKKGAQALAFYGSLAACLGVSALIFGLYHVGPLAYDSANPWQPTASRLLVGIGVWGLTWLAWSRAPWARWLRVRAV